MNRFILMAVISVSLATIAPAQVDTLMLIEDYSLDFPQPLRAVYVENITDSTKALFACTRKTIHVFDSQSLAPIWNSPQLACPADLRFADMNDDGMIDIVAKDSFFIYIYDFMNDQELWSSPPLGENCRCHAVGDFDNDGIDDIVVVSQVPTPEEFDNDTVWVETYSGPQYQLADRFRFFAPNYHHMSGDPFPIEDIRIETVEKIFVTPLARQNENIGAAAIYSNYYYYQAFDEGPGTSGTSGNLRLFFDGQSRYYADVGENTFAAAQTENGLNILTDASFSIDAIYIWRTLTVRGHRISCDAFQEMELWEVLYYYYPPYRVIDPVGDDYLPENPGYELCCASCDSACLVDLSNFSCLWNRTYSSDFLILLGKYHSTFLGGDYVLCKSENYSARNMLINANTGALEGVFNNIININLIADLDSDGSDEIFFNDVYTLYIYHLEKPVAIDQPAIPHSTFLQPNYPNPFNASTTIEYGLDSDQQVTIDIYDLLGRKVETLVDEPKPAGLYRAIWDAGELPSGMYFCRIVTDSYSKTRKMMLLK